MARAANTGYEKPNSLSAPANPPGTPCGNGRVEDLAARGMSAVLQQKAQDRFCRCPDP